MLTLRHLRRSRSLTFFDVAQLTGIPVRMLAEAEYGLRALTVSERYQLALVFGLNEQLFSPPSTPTQLHSPQQLARTIAATTLAAALVGTAITPVLQLWEAGTVAGRIAASSLSAAGAVAHVSTTVPTTGAANMPVVREAPTAVLATGAANMPVVHEAPTTVPATGARGVLERTDTPTPAFEMTIQGPRGCPLHPAVGHVVMTQGYSVGTHAPGDSMGAIDLAIDGAGTGYRGDLTYNTIVLATHAGIARVQADTWPAGNHVWVADEQSGWRSGYAHLASFLVVDGQAVVAGQPIGLVGSTGWSTGPHLHYHLWHNNVNTDPTELAVDCFG